MKKFLSLLAALVLLVCAAVPAMAEETAPAAFGYTLEAYKLFFDELAESAIDVTPVWSVEEGVNVATVEGYGTVAVEINEAGYVTRLSTSSIFALEEIDAVGGALGMLVVVTAVSSKCTEDVTFATEENVNAFTNELLMLLLSLMNGLNTADGTSVAISDVVGEDIATFMLAYDESTMAVGIGFTYEP